MLTTLEWARERLENSERLALLKTGADRDGWLEDVAYWHAIVEQLTSAAAREQALAALVARWREAAKEADHRLGAVYRVGNDTAVKAHALERRIWATCAADLEKLLVSPSTPTTQEPT